MKKSEFRGAAKVFSFTLIQTLKNRAYLVFTALMVLFSALSMPLMHAIQNMGEESGVAKIENIRQILWYDETEALFGSSFTQMGLQFTKMLAEPAFSGVTFEEAELPYETVLSALKEDEAYAHTVIARLFSGELGLTLEVVRPVAGAVTEDEGDYLADKMTESIAAFKEEATGLTKSQQEVLKTQVSLLVQRADENGSLKAKEDTVISNAQYWIIYGLAFVGMLVSTIASSQVASSIVVDKSTRVVEYLLTSVRPMALVVGKTLAMLLASIGQMFVMIAILLTSNWLTGRISGEESFLQGILPEGIWSNITPLNLLVSAIMICLGFLFYAVLAAMCGAMASRIEQTQESLMLLTVSNCIGIYLAVMAANELQISGKGALVTFTMFFPLSSPYLMPGMLLTGSAAWGNALVSILLLLVVDALLFKFVATIYELLITHNGSPIKGKELLGIYKSLKKEHKKGEAGCTR